MMKAVVTGLKEIDDKIKDIEAKTCKKAFRKATRQGVKEYGEALKAETPVRTGNFLGAYKVRASKPKGAIGCRVIVDSDKLESPDYYPAFYEYGTPTQPARPFMRQIFERDYDQIHQTVLDVVKEELDLN